MLLRTTVTSAGSLALFLLLASASTGCAREDYYCDSSGCFYCDGVGCRGVTPPSRTACAGDFACTNGTVCTDLGCATPCRQSSECAPGWICRGGAAGDAGADAGAGQGLCVSPTERDPVRTPGACRTSTDCSAGTLCIDGLCQRSSTPTCVADADCSGGKVCVAGRCQTPSTLCQFDNQCGAGRACVNSQCRTRCSTTTPCTSGQQCTSVGGVNVCTDATTGGCVRDSECGASGRCVDARCYARCMPGVTTCAASDQYCTDDGICAPDTRTRPFCDGAHPCAGGSSCVGGVCRVACASTLDCQRTDVSYRNCARLPTQPDNAATYCITDNEARPTCVRQSDCARGQSCVDAVCR